MSQLPSDDQVTQVTQAPPLPSADRLDTGAMIGDIQLGQRAGEGLSSVVYEARNLLVGKRCAVKLLRPELAIGPVKRGRLLHAARRADSLGLPGAVATFDGGVTGDGQTTYLVQQWCEGRPLRQLLAEHGALSRRAYLPLMRQICQTLAAAHGAGLAHRALHGGNILVLPGDGGPQIKLLDFGIHEAHPKVDEQLPGLERSADHAFYLAPEQVKGQPGDAKSDIYALSALLYEMITGRPPLAAETFEATAERHLNDTPLTPSELASLPGELETTILRGLEKDPGRRIPSVEALLAALDPLSTTTGQHQALKKTPSQELRRPTLPSDEQPAEARRSLGAAELTLAPRRSRRWIAYVAVAAALIIAGGAALVLTIGPDDSGLQVRKPRKRRPRRVRRKAPAPRVNKRKAPAVAPKAKAPAAIPRPSTRREPTASKRERSPLRRESRLARPKVARNPGRLRLGRIASKLTAIKGFGTIHISTRDPRAKIYLDGRHVGTGSSKTLRRIPAGKHRVHVVIGGRAQAPKLVQLEPKGSVEVQL